MLASDSSIGFVIFNWEWLTGRGSQGDSSRMDARFVVLVLGREGKAPMRRGMLAYTETALLSLAREYGQWMYE